MVHGSDPRIRRIGVNLAISFWAQSGGFLLIIVPAAAYRVDTFEMSFLLHRSILFIEKYMEMSDVGASCFINLGGSYGASMPD